MTAPILLLDVDGVIAPFGTLPPGRRAQLERVTTLKYMGTFYIDRRVTDALSALHAAGVVELHWCTSWEADAPEVLGPHLGEPYEHLHVHESRDAAHTDEWFKQHAARSLLGAGERVIWCDDDIARRSTLPEHPRLLTLSPEPSIGLTMTDVERIRQWATA